MIPRELEVNILRLHEVEKWPVGTIATQLRVHHEVVVRVLAQAQQVKARSPRASQLDPFVPFVQETWEKYPKLLPSRLYVMCRERGYSGSPNTFRQRVASYRPRPRSEAFLRLRTLPGEQG